MSSPDRRPSADELERLIEQVRRDPGSRAFLTLGDAYLSLGRARDAVEVGVAGLRTAPDDVEGRMLVARALAALHQWKEAQAELLKVVKVDRNHRTGFALLGEVLLRRGDHERALPVLQHAQNLDPSNPQVLTLVRRARAGQPLDPPPPIPTPVEPARKRPGPSRPPPPPAMAPAPARGGVDLDDAPTSIGGPTLRDDPTDVSRSPHGDELTGEITEDPVAPAPRRPAPAPPAPRKPSPVVLPPVEPVMPAVRPRVISQAKPPNPAAEALRQSASAGENYLNDLLTGGLLEIPGVRVPDSEFDIKPDRRWGHSGGRALVALFVLLVLGAGGGVTYWYFNEQHKAEEVRTHRAAASKIFVTGSFEDLNKAAGELAAALEADRTNAGVFADVAEVTALQALLYGVPAGNAQDAIAQAQRDITKPTQDGYEQLVVARAAVAMATLTDQSDATASLATARSAIEDYLADHADDRWAQWLLGRTMLLAGERTSARATFQAAADGDAGLVPAMIDLADLMVDDGDLPNAIKTYERALTAAPKHPLALVGEVLAWAENGVERDKVLPTLSTELGEKKFFGPRVRSYRNLAYALAQYQIEKYDEFSKALATALDQAPHEPRYLGRVALAELLGGDFATAAKARAQIAWFGKGKPEADPVVDIFDAALLVESGLPQRAITVLGSTGGVRAHLIRAQALIDLGAYDSGQLKAALDEAKQACTLSSSCDITKHPIDNVEAQAMFAWAEVLNASGAERDKIVVALNGIANGMVSKRGRHIEGASLYAIGGSEARAKLEDAVANIDTSDPNPIAYRTHTLLARLDLIDGKLEDAGKEVDAALTANGGYLPAMVVKAKILLAAGAADDALAALKPVLGQQEAVTAEVELAYAEGLAARKDVTAADKANAADAVRKAQKMGAAPAELGRVAALIDPDLPDQLGVPAPAGAPAPPGAPAPAPAPHKPAKRHHHR